MKLTKRIASLAAAAAVVVGGATAVSTVAAPTAGAYAYYGAIALSPSTGAWGRALDYSTRSAAQRTALNYCPYNDCRVVTSFVNGCGAVALSSRYWGYGRGDDLYTAQSWALSSAGGGYIYTWACTSGHS